MLSELTPAPELPKVDLEAEMKRRLQEKRRARENRDRSIESPKKTPLEKLEERVRERKDDSRDKRSRHDDRDRHRDDWVIFLKILEQYKINFLDY